MINFFSNYTERWFVLTSLISFFALGLIGAMLGSVLPDLSSIIGVSIANAGIVRSGRQLGQLSSILVGGYLTNKYTCKAIIVFGTAFMSLGLLCLPISNNVVLAVSSAILWGVGHGLIHIGIMVLTKTYSINFTNALITLNIVYGMGAVVSPFLVECFRMVNLEDLFVFCALISILVGVVFFQISQQKKLVISYKLTDLHRDAKMISLFSILIFISNGANCGLADWIYTHIVLVTQSPSYVSSAIVSFYWLAQIFGRIVSMFIVGRVSDQRIMEICGATSLIGGVFLFFSDSLIMIAIGTVVISLGYAPMYPLILALGEKESIAKGKVLGYLSSSASFGAIVIPFIQGKAGKSETGGMGVIFVCSIIICIIIYSYAFWNRNATKK